MKADPADQRRLLDIADLDLRIRAADHDRRNPPQAARVSELVQQRQVLSQELSQRLGTRDDLQIELRRIESDVAVVDARRARDVERLQTVTSPKDAQGLEHEIESLARRKSDLEDAELEVMEKLESAEAAVTEQEQAVEEINSEGAQLSAEGKAAVAEAGERFDHATRDRAALAATVDDALLAMYDRLAARGTGAGLLRTGTCGGCRMVLSGTDLGRVRQAPADEVVTCPECGCILIRDDE